MCSFNIIIKRLGLKAINVLEVLELDNTSIYLR